jgi:hypothetical protein
MKIFIMKFSPLPRYVFPLSLNILLNFQPNWSLLFWRGLLAVFCVITGFWRWCLLRQNRQTDRQTMYV